MNAILNALTFSVKPIQFRGQAGGLRRIVLQKNGEGQIHLAQPSRGVDAGPQLERHLPIGQAHRPGAGLG